LGTWHSTIDKIVRYRMRDIQDLTGQMRKTQTHAFKLETFTLHRFIKACDSSQLCTFK
jgi:hypothetical protein